MSESIYECVVFQVQRMSSQVQTLYEQRLSRCDEHLTAMVDELEKSPSFEDHARISATLSTRKALTQFLARFNDQVQFMRFDPDTSVRLSNLDLVSISLFDISSVVVVLIFCYFMCFIFHLLLLCYSLEHKVAYIDLKRMSTVNDVTHRVLFVDSI